MSQSPTLEIGTITWTYLGAENTREIRDFYVEVVGWKTTPVNMGDNNDLNMSHSNSKIHKNN